MSWRGIPTFPRMTLKSTLKPFIHLRSNSWTENWASRSD
jgi:hypothetical protein